MYTLYGLGVHYVQAEGGEPGIKACVACANQGKNPSTTYSLTWGYALSRHFLELSTISTYDVLAQ